MRTRFAAIALAVFVAGLVAIVVVFALNRRTKHTAAVAPVATTTPSTEIATSTTTPTTTPLASTTTNLGQAGLDKTDLLERTQPFVQVLPHETSHYKVDYRAFPDRSITLQITLYAILNNERQLPAYEATLRQYKQEALDWIRSQNQDPASFSITYNPPEAATA